MKERCKNELKGCVCVCVYMDGQLLIAVLLLLVNNGVSISFIGHLQNHHTAPCYNRMHLLMDTLFS